MVITEHLLVTTQIPQGTILSSLTDQSLEKIYVRREEKGLRDNSFLRLGVRCPVKSHLKGVRKLGSQVRNRCIIKGPTLKSWISGYFSLKYRGSHISCMVSSYLMLYSNSFEIFLFY